MSDLKLRPYGGRFALFDLAGKRVSGMMDGQMAELQRDKRAARGRVRVRPCLTCGTDFESEGAHNRMCAECRRTGASLG